MRFTCRQKKNYMPKKSKQTIQLIEGVDPGLFGQKHSSRDYRYEESWGKNQFNSSFPVSLVAYMSSKNISPVFICTNRDNEIVHEYIPALDLLGIDPLSDDAYYDYFVWSNLSVVQLALRESTADNDISRNQRTIIWLYKMLWDFTQYGKFNYTDIVNSLSYKYKTDKAFAISGRLTNAFLKSAELTHPRVSKFEIKNIILGDGQKLLRPERRFDAYLVSHPELFV